MANNCIQLKTSSAVFQITLVDYSGYQLRVKLVGKMLGAG